MRCFRSDIYQSRVCFRDGEKMPPKTLLIGITVLSIVIILAGVSWTLFSNNQTVTPPPSSSSPSNQDTGTSDTDNQQATNTDNTTPNDNSTQPITGLSSQEQMRDSAMVYVKGNHSETTALMNDLSWIGGRDENAPTDTERYIYYSGNWSVTIEYPTTSESPTYNITGTYNSAVQYVQFTETVTNGSFTITSYSNQKYPQQP
jgi:cytoskeletal protein RodZ